MQSPFVASNGTKVGEDETEVLAGSREVALCLPIDMGAAFRFRLRKRASRKVGGGRRDGSKPLGRIVGLPDMSV
jgi:hypothetical protein